MIPKSISQHVLVVGPDYHNHRGGIGSVIGSHRDQYEVFNFIPSFKPYKNNLFKSFYFLIQVLKIIGELTTNKQIRIVHIHSSKDGSMYRKLCVAYISKHVFRKRIINHIHTGNFKLFYDGSNTVRKKIISFFLRLSDATVAVSGSWKDYFETQFKLQNVYKVSNMVSMPSGFSAERRGHFGEINFLFLGLIINDKGIFDLLTVLAAHKSVFYKKLKLIIAGNGDVARLSTLVKEHKLEDIVEFKGWVKDNEKAELLRQTDVFILPSYYEGLPVAVLEAMSYGKAIISTKVGGIPEVVEVNGNGILIQPGDHEAILEALLLYINDPGNIGIHGRRSLQIIENYLPQSIVPKMEAIYAGLLNQTQVTWQP